MKERGKQDSTPYNTSYLTGNQPTTNQGPVFPGKPSTPNPYGNQNLAVQRGLMEIFDDFTQIISGELKSMNAEQFQAENKTTRNPGQPE